MIFNPELLKDTLSLSSITVAEFASSCARMITLSQECFQQLASIEIFKVGSKKEKSNNIKRLYTNGSIETALYKQHQLKSSKRENFIILKRPNRKKKNQSVFIKTLTDDLFYLIRHMQRNKVTNFT